MPLTYEPDVSVADWVVHADVPWQVLATQGPPGFEAYATVRFDTAEDDAYRADPALVALVTRLAAAWTRSPDQAWFGLWEGWDLEGRVYASMDPGRHFGRFFRHDQGPRTSSAFSRDVLDGPHARLGDDRAYLLFTGAVADVGDWGARPAAPDWPRDMPQASFTWPADHAWCITSDVDPEWFCVGGSHDLVDAVVAHPDLDAEPAQHGVLPPTQEPA